jgi:hypothetical protein
VDVAVGVTAVTGSILNLEGLDGRALGVCERRICSGR